MLGPSSSAWDVAGGHESASGHAVQINPLVSPPPDVLVYEFGARLDDECAGAVFEQIRKARFLYNSLVERIRFIHEEMNAWVLERAGPDARDLQTRLTGCEHDIGAARSRSDVAALRLLSPLRVELGKELTPLLRPVREQHRAAIKSLFFSRVGNTRATETYQLRCQAVADGLGWATATMVLDSALLAWKRTLVMGRAPKAADQGRHLQDTLVLQFTDKGGLPAERVLDGSNREIHLCAPEVARRRAYGRFRFRLGLAKDNVYATGGWQYHRPLPSAAHVSSARLVHRRVADQDRWVLQLVLRLPEPIHLPSAPVADLACLHFGWMKSGKGRRVVTVARSADPGAVECVELAASVEDDLQRYAALQSGRAKSRAALVPKIAALASSNRLPAGAIAAEVDAMVLQGDRVAPGKIYRLQTDLANVGIRRAWLDQWVSDDRKKWQAAVMLARRARGRRRDFYRVTALRLARDHRAIVVEPLDLKAASKSQNPQTGGWADFSHHARAGRVIAALHEFEAAIRWACVRHGTPVFELKAMTSQTCAVCGSAGVTAAPGHPRAMRCAACGASHDRHANAAACAWQWAHQGLDIRLESYRSEAQAQQSASKARADAIKEAVASKRWSVKEEGP
ncbi:zinc ribbon domain-containing protein [Ramlibacter sp. WS9]|uniref:zinc ribbon domain-containing protein n=1 Tax=Ramlibacter sp. WS9 TaxID=1882741 RepID=UPI001144C780|nr:zinc ribbon domain-containing protein [Ramlibacter sp. WS9]ROZ78366.1 hypothetical protein EEB15_08000 [Ramlibacter sp. WS9]